MKIKVLLLILLLMVSFASAQTNDEKSLIEKIKDDSIIFGDITKEQMTTQVLEKVDDLVKLNKIQFAKAVGINYVDWKSDGFKMDSEENIVFPNGKKIPVNFFKGKNVEFYDGYFVLKGDKSNINVDLSEGEFGKFEKKEDGLYIGNFKLKEEGEYTVEAANEPGYEADEQLKISFKDKIEVNGFNVAGKGENEILMQVTDKGDVGVKVTKGDNVQVLHNELGKTIKADLKTGAKYYWKENQKKAGFTGNAQISIEGNNQEKFLKSNYASYIILDKYGDVKNVVAGYDEKKQTNDIAASYTEKIVKDGRLVTKRVINTKNGQGMTIFNEDNVGQVWGVKVRLQGDKVLVNEDSLSDNHEVSIRNGDKNLIYAKENGKFNYYVIRDEPLIKSEQLIVKHDSGEVNIKLGNIEAISNDAKVGVEKVDFAVNNPEEQKEMANELSDFFINRIKDLDGDVGFSWDDADTVKKEKKYASAIPEYLEKEGIISESDANEFSGLIKGGEKSSLEPDAKRVDVFNAPKGSTSISDLFNSNDLDSSFKNRKKYYEAKYGTKIPYAGTAEQNNRWVKDLVAADNQIEVPDGKEISKIGQESNIKKVTQEVIDITLEKNFVTNEAQGCVFGSPSDCAVRITSKYGNRQNPDTGVYKKHNGIDIAMNKGTTVVAVSSGTVVQVEEQGGYGQVVAVEHIRIINGKKTKVYSLYAHLDRNVPVEVGQKVKKGEKIALVGKTGAIRGYHLHLEIREGENTKFNSRNPLTYINKNFNQEDYRKLITGKKEVCC